MSEVTTLTDLISLLANPHISPTICSISHTSAHSIHISYTRVDHSLHCP